MTTEGIALDGPAIRAELAAMEPKPAKEPCRSHPLPCPECGEMDASISICIADLDGADCVKCESCEYTFSLDKVRNVIARWQPILAWLDTMPHPAS